MKDKLKAFLKKKDIEVSVKRYGIDALGAMAVSYTHLGKVYCLYS